MFLCILAPSTTSLPNQQSTHNVATKKRSGSASPILHQNGPQPSRTLPWLIALAVMIIVVVIYHPVIGYGFVDLDDNDYFAKNPNVLRGFTLEGVKWAFTTREAANWHPLTWLSLMLDATLYGRTGMGPHTTNLLLHCVNALLVFALFRKLTGTLWRSALVASLFAAHPIHVESVAWISERKDVLSMLFGLLAMLQYARNRESRRIIGHVLVALFMALSLMAKPMFVTLPFLLLLIDFWPLQRFGPIGSFNRMDFGRKVLEKLPLLAISIASSIITVIAQRGGGAMHRLDNLSLTERIQNALVAYGAYIRKAIAPIDLCAYYPLPINGVAPSASLFALAVLVAISWLVLRWYRSHPFLLTGWLWFLGTLVPVIGIVQVGNQSMADRYAYLPFLGLYILFAWGLGAWAERHIWARAPIKVIAGIGLLLCIGAATKQVRYWKDSVSLFGRALEVTTDNTMAEGNYGMAVGRLGRHDEAIEHLTKALRLWPGFFDAHYNMGVALAAKGRTKEAIVHYREALALKPGTSEVHLNVATAYAKLGRFEEARMHLDSVLVVDPENAAAHVNAGMIHLHLQELPEAIAHLERAVRSDPKSSEAQNNLGLAYELGGRNAEAIAQYKTALRLAPNNAQARKNLDRTEAAAESAGPSPGQ